MRKTGKKKLDKDKAEKRRQTNLLKVKNECESKVCLYSLLRSGDVFSVDQQNPPLKRELNLTAPERSVTATQPTVNAAPALTCLSLSSSASWEQKSDHHPFEASVVSFYFDGVHRGAGLTPPT